jgi:hypothetical protein
MALHHATANLLTLQAMSLAGLFPEVPTKEFQLVDTTSQSADAASVLSGSTSTSRDASRPHTASPGRPLTGRSANGGGINLSSVVKQALSASFPLSAADCLHACHAHLTDPENFWKCINDACVGRVQPRLKHLQRA